MMLAIAVIVTPVFVASVLSAPEGPLQDGLFPPTATGQETARFDVHFHTDPPVTVTALESGDVRVQTARPLSIADPLLYWVPDGADVGEAAVLVGSFRANGEDRLAVPDAAMRSGDLVIFDLGIGEELARAAWPGFQP